MRAVRLIRFDKINLNKGFQIKESLKRELRHLYGTSILFFYYAKWFIFLGLPWLYFGLDYKDNWILDIIWVICLILIIKDFIYKFVLKKSYCDKRSCGKDKNGNNSKNESE